MTFTAEVVRVLIASLGDTANERKILRGALEDWNSLHGEQGVMVLPRMWGRDATPAMTDRPQGVINTQLVDSADMLIGVFWTRLGTPTSEAASGTVEEIERCIAAGKPVLLYFSSKPVAMGSVDPVEYERLVQARDDFRERGLVESFETEEELWRKATADLTRTIREHFAPSLDATQSESDDSASAPRALLLARISRDGRHERLTLENRGSATAEDVTFDVVVLDGRQEPSLLGTTLRSGSCHLRVLSTIRWPRRSGVRRTGTSSSVGLRTASNTRTARRCAEALGTSRDMRASCAPVAHPNTAVLSRLRRHSVGSAGKEEGRRGPGQAEPS